MKDSEILEQNGWTIECDSPYEISHTDGSFATGNAVRLIVDSLKESYHANKIIQFKYKNWKGEESIRNVMPIEIWFGETEFHKESQWFMHGFDVDKKEDRHFAILDILEFIK